MRNFPPRRTPRWKSDLGAKCREFVNFYSNWKNSRAICNKDWKISQSVNGAAWYACSNWTGKGMQQFGTWHRKTWEKFNNDWDKTIPFTFISPFWTSDGSNAPSNTLLHFYHTTPPPFRENSILHTRFHEDIKSLTNLA